MTKFLKGTPLLSRRYHYLMLTAIWLYTFAPPVASGIFFGFTGRVPLAIQVLNAAWLVLVAFAPPSLSDLVESYAKYVEAWRAENEQQEDDAQTQVPRRHS
jgi:hypothetical protein